MNWQTDQREVATGVTRGDLLRDMAENLRAAGEEIERLRNRIAELEKEIGNGKPVPTN